MSDFLNQFTKENYDREKMKIKDNLSDDVKTIDLEQAKEQATEIKEQAVDDTVKQEKDSKPKAEAVDTNASLEEIIAEEITVEDHKAENDYIRDEETELDPEYKKKRRNKFIAIGVAAAVLIASFTALYYNSSHVNMPDFVTAGRQDVVTWANKNKMQVIYDDEFSTDIDEDLVISQSVEPKTKVKKGSDLKFVISAGADPDEKITIPDFAKMKASEIESWVTDNKMRYVQVEYVYSTEVEKDTFMSFEITDKDVTKDKFLRKNKAMIKISKGEEKYEKNILVLNFKSKSKEEIEQWHKEKEFVEMFVFEEAYDDKIPEGTVISQDPEMGTKIAKNDVITFVISKGKAILAPNYYGSELSTFDTVPNSGATAISKEWYSMDLPYGAFISQSIAAGTVLNDDPEAMILVYYSIGQPYIKGIESLTEGDLPQYFYEYQSKGANLTYSVVRAKDPDCAMKGVVFKSSHSNEYVSTNQHITVYISDGTGTCSTTPEE